MKYFCTNCSAEFLKWSGKCPTCGEWGSLQEIEVSDVSTTKGSSNDVKAAKSFSVNEIKLDSEKYDRISTGFSEVDRVLGGGVVPGSISLIAGEPGVGKSTLLSQVALKLVALGKSVLYVSGEESGTQIFSRLKRIGIDSSYSSLQICEDTNVERICQLISEKTPDLVIVDSIQSMYSDTVRSYAGSIGQVRVCGVKLTRCAKETSSPIFLVGQINKEGSVAGPKVLEHIVDVVLQIEGGEYSQFRVLRAAKNRFGATDEIGVFEMGFDGLVQVENPSSAFLDKEGWGLGSALGAVLKGSRVVFVEVQALVVERGGDAGPLRRVANGVKKQRLDMLCAVMTKRARVFLGDKDVFVNVVGGVEIDDPSLDLAICASIKASVNDISLSSDVVYFGEVGLTGEIRKGFSYKSVAKEAKRLGYKLLSNGSKLRNVRDI